MTDSKEVKVEYPDDKLKEPKFGSQVLGFFETVSAVPTLPPKNYLDQVQFYSSSGTFRIYIYDTIGGAWHQVATS